MEKTMIIQVTDVSALRILRNLEDQRLIRILNDQLHPAQARQFQNHSGSFSDGSSVSYNGNTPSMFTDWDSNSDCRDNDSCDCE